MTPVADTARHSVSLISRHVRRARIVRPSGKFLMSELRGRSDQPVEYRLVNGAGTVLIRHHNHEDGFVVSEVFDPDRGTYALPDAVRETVTTLPVRRIVDLGGNIGIALLFFARQFPAARFVVVEADPGNADLLERVVTINGLTERVTTLRVAAGTYTGRVSFASGLGGRSHVTSSDDEPTIEVQMVDVLPQLMDADLLKMDIEGGEWAILADPRIRNSDLRAICLEFHEWCCPTENPTSAVTHLLEAAGFEVVDLREELAGGVAWAVRRQPG